MSRALIRMPPRSLSSSAAGTSALGLAALFALLAGAGASPASAGQGVWTPLGPYGGSVTALAFSSGPGTGAATLYAGTASSGLFRSDDLGVTWQPVPKGPGGGQIQSLALAAGQPSTLHVALDGKTWRSDDGGTSWKPTAFPLATSCLAVAPSISQVVYGANGFSVFASGDGGATVHQVAPVSRLFVLIRALAVSPLSPSELFAVTNQGLFKSADGGSTWSLLPVGGLAVALTIDPFSAATLYAGTADGAFIVSHDGGSTWTRQGSGLGAGSVDVIAADPAARGTLYAGVNGDSTAGIWKSVDGGATFVLSTATVKVDALAASAARPGMVLAGLEPAGVLASLDGGTTWTATNHGLSGTVVIAAAADPFTPGTLYASVYSHNQHNFDVTGIDDQALPLGLQRSRDGGSTWTRADRGLDASFVVKLVAHPGRQGLLYAAANDSSAQLFVSTDGADSWQPASGTPGVLELLDLAVDPKHPGFLYLVGGDLVGRQGIFTAERSTDGGASWTVLSHGAAPALDAVALDPAWPARVYFGGKVLLKSYHRGDALAAIGSGFPRGGAIYKLLTDPGLPNRVYALTVPRVSATSPTDSFNRSLDAGATWATASAGLPQRPLQLFDLAVEPAAAALFLSSDAGIFLSYSGGARWRAVSAGLAGVSGGLLLADPFHPGTVLTAPELGGLWTFSIAR
jgi:photosystem II stability/assembly factor-like uncharacterized protein